jgi:hypothetical protein
VRASKLSKSGLKRQGEVTAPSPVPGIRVGRQHRYGVRQATQSRRSNIDHLAIATNRVAAAVRPPAAVSTTSIIGEQAAP